MTTGRHTLLRRFFSRAVTAHHKTGMPAGGGLKRALRPAARALAVVATALTITASTGAVAGEFNTSATQTAHSQYIADLQERYGNLPGHLKTAIVDTDKIRAEMAARGADADDISTGEGILIDQARAQTGQQMSDEVSFYIYKTLENEHPEAFQMRLDDMVGRFDERSQMCVVTTMSPDHTDTSANRYVYFQHPAVYGALSQAEPLTGFTRDHLRRYTDLHEVAHCLDERYERSLVNGNAVARDEGLYTQHKSDAFADVLAGLLMARDGATDAPGRRADMRTVNSHMVGPYLGQMGSKGFQDKYLQHAGAIYTVQRPLSEAQKWIDSLPPGRLGQMSTQALIDKAYELVEAHALTKTEFNDISGWHTSPEYLDSLEQMAARNDVFADAYKQRLAKMQAYIDAGEATTRRVFGLGPDDALPVADTAQTVTPMGPFAFTDAAEKQELTRAAGQEIAAELGNRPATPDNLMQAYIRTADRLRLSLDSTDDAAQKRTTRGMLVTLPDALRHSRDFIKPKSPRMADPKSRSRPTPG